MGDDLLIISSNKNSASYTSSCVWKQETPRQDFVAKLTTDRSTIGIISTQFFYRTSTITSSPLPSANNEFEEEQSTFSTPAAVTTTTDVVVEPVQNILEQPMVDQEKRNSLGDEKNAQIIGPSSTFEPSSKSTSSSTSIKSPSSLSISTLELEMTTETSVSNQENSFNDEDKKKESFGFTMLDITIVIVSMIGGLFIVLFITMALIKLKKRTNQECIEMNNIVRKNSQSECHM